jgi:hypothetical protein
MMIELVRVSKVYNAGQPNEFSAVREVTWHRTGPRDRAARAERFRQDHAAGP